MKKLVKVRLFNGAKTKQAWNPESPNFVDDWKPDETEILAESFQITYGHHMKIWIPEDMIELSWDSDGFIEYEGVFYGDVEVSA